MIFDSLTRLPYAALQTMFTRFGTLQEVTSALLSGVQGLFRNFGATFVPLLRPHLEKLAVDSQVWMCAWSRCEPYLVVGVEKISYQLSLIQGLSVGEENKAADFKFCGHFFLGEQSTVCL